VPPLHSSLVFARCSGFSLEQFQLLALGSIHSSFGHLYGAFHFCSA